LGELIEKSDAILNHKSARTIVWQFRKSQTETWRQIGETGYCRKLAQAVGLIRLSIYRAKNCVKPKLLGLYGSFHPIVRHQRPRRFVSNSICRRRGGIRHQTWTSVARSRGMLPRLRCRWNEYIVGWASWCGWCLARGI